MAIVRIAGKVNEATNLLPLLYNSGWDIHNSHLNKRKSQQIRLLSIEQKIKQADAFLFLGLSNIEDMFLLISVIVGKQTFDINLRNKPVILFDPENSWGDFINLYNYLRKQGTVVSDLINFVKIVHTHKEIITILDGYYDLRGSVAEIEERNFLESQKPLLPKNDNSKKPNYSICVFCSSLISKPEYLDFAYNIGKEIALKGYGCVTGAGKSGMMGMVVRGSGENGGWTFGSNIARLVALEGVPETINQFIPSTDIYSRIDIMIKNSNEFWILPGGTGTLQELLALILLKEQSHPLMKGKKIKLIPFKLGDKQKNNFWHLFELIAKKYGATSLIEF
jgi:uncharacterized protein (TIGR00730 family)